MPGNGTGYFGTLIASECRLSTLMIVALVRLVQINLYLLWLPILSKSVCFLGIGTVTQGFEFWAGVLDSLMVSWDGWWVAKGGKDRFDWEIVW